MKIHIVQKGDTLWKIAQKYHVDFEMLKKMNQQLADPDQLMPGMKIKVPAAGVPIKGKGNMGPAKEKPKKELAKKEISKKESPKKESPKKEEPKMEKKEKPKKEITKEAEPEKPQAKKEKEPLPKIKKENTYGKGQQTKKSGGLPPLPYPPMNVPLPENYWEKAVDETHSSVPKEETTMHHQKPAWDMNSPMPGNPGAMPGGHMNVPMPGNPGAMPGGHMNVPMPGNPGAMPGGYVNAPMPSNPGAMPGGNMNTPMPGNPAMMPGGYVNAPMPANPHLTGNQAGPPMPHGQLPGFAMPDEGQYVPYPSSSKNLQKSAQKGAGKGHLKMKGDCHCHQKSPKMPGTSNVWKPWNPYIPPGAQGYGAKKE